MQNTFIFIFKVVRISGCIVETIHVVGPSRDNILWWRVININIMYKMWTTFWKYTYNITIEIIHIIYMTFINTITELGSTHLIP